MLFLFIWRISRGKYDKLNDDDDDDDDGELFLLRRKRDVSHFLTSLAVHKNAHYLHLTN